MTEIDSPRRDRSAFLDFVLRHSFIIEYFVISSPGVSSFVMPAMHAWTDMDRIRDLV